MHQIGDVAMHKREKHRLLTFSAILKLQVIDFIELVRCSTILHNGYYARFIVFTYAAGNYQ